MYFNLNSHENETIEFLPKDLRLSNLGNKTLIIAGYEHIKISIFHWLAANKWLKEDDDLHPNNPFLFSQIHSFESENIPSKSAFFAP